MPGRDNRLDISPYGEVADDLHPSRRGRRNQIVKDRVDRGLVEYVPVTESIDIELQRLELDDVLGRDVGDSNDREVGEPGAGTGK